MSEIWVQDCKDALDQIKKLENAKGQDRLDIVRTISFTLYALQRSVSGWIEWVNDPEVMTSFSLRELKEINRNLAKLARTFIEYDCEVTSLAQGDLTIREHKKQGPSKKKTNDKTERFYIK